MFRIIQIFIFFYSLSLMAQIRTTGGGENNYHKMWPKIETMVLEKVTPQMNIDVKIELLTLHLLKIEKKCKMRNSLDIDHSFMSSYYNLTFKKIRGQNNHVKTDYQCQLDQKVAECLNDIDLKNLVNSITKDPKTFDYLQGKFKLEKKSAESVLDFFANPGDDSN